VRISELGERAGVSVATIKFYIRERLLSAGERTSYNQVSYHGTHLGRIRLLRALLGIGGLSVAEAREVVAAVEDPDRTAHSTLGAAQRDMSQTSVDEVLATADRLGHDDVAELLTAYRAAAVRLAAIEIAWLARAGDDPDALTERAVIGTVLGDALLTAVRREAQKEASEVRLQPPSVR